MSRRTCIGMIVVAALGLVWGAGCRGHEASTRVSADGTPLIGLHEDHSPAWRGLTPEESTPRTPDRLSSELSAFDYWRVDDAETVGDIWGAVFPVLQMLRTDASEKVRRESLDLIMEAIEPRDTSSRTRMDLTFVVGTDDATAYEGLACRFFRSLDNGGTPAVTFLLLNHPGRRSDPARILVWASPGFEGIERWTADFRRDGDSWSNVIVSGLHRPSARTLREAKRGGNQSVQLAARVLTRRLWTPFSGRNYTKTTSTSSSSDSDGLSEAMGLEVRDRRIPQVYSNTAFPPRADVDLPGPSSSE